MTIVYILIAILMLGVLIFLHELGHYLVGRAMNIGINEFAIGMGPKIFSRQGTHKIKINGEYATETTTYSLRALPLGGFCAFVGEDDENDDPRAMNKAPAWKRFLTVLAGPFMNIFVAFLIGVVLISAGLTRNIYDFEPEYLSITEISAGSPAEQAGIMLNDKVLSANGISMLKKDISNLTEQIEKGEEIALELERNEEVVNLSLTPKMSEDGAYRIGVIITAYGKYADYDCNVFEAFGESFKLMWNITKETYTSLPRAFRSLFVGEEREVKGVVGIVHDMSVSLGEGFSSTFSDGVVMMFLYLMLISVSLGIMNLLPIPALDGGRLLFLLIELITGKHLNRKLEGYINFVFLMLLLLFMFYIMFFDVKALF